MGASENGAAFQDAEGGRIREVVGEEGRLRTKLVCPELLLAYLFQRELPCIDKLQIIQQLFC